MPPSIQPWDFWREVLKSPRCVLAPMVDASELAWRLISRKYGAQLVYTPMTHAGMFIRDIRYRRDSIASCPEDRPLIAQVLTRSKSLTETMQFPIFIHSSAPMIPRRFWKLRVLLNPTATLSTWISDARKPSPRKVFLVYLFTKQFDSLEVDFWTLGHYGAFLQDEWDLIKEMGKFHWFM